MRTIELTNSPRFALVDDDDYDLVTKHNWFLDRSPLSGRPVYARTYPGVYMHRLILVAPEGLSVDHANMDGLDNRRCNLRLATKAQQKQNSGKLYRNGIATSDYKGVYWARTKNKWCAQIRVEGRLINLGYSHDEEEAARMYDAAARQYFGEFARGNFRSGCK